MKIKKRTMAALLIAAASWLPNCSFADEKSSPDAEPSKEVEQENWNAKFQGTYIGQHKPSFNAPYSGAFSLSPDRETSFSTTLTAYLGFRPWKTGEIYFNEEMISTFAFSNLHGLGGLTNAEQQKSNYRKPKYYRARIFLRQTFGLGGEQDAVESSPNQLAGMVDRRRWVVTVGTISPLDIFDVNAYAHDPRTQFVNWAFFTHGSFDYASDARGYTTGAAVEYFHDDWAFRVGRFQGPIESNGLRLNSRLGLFHGDQAEVERSHSIYGQPGKIRLLGFRNREIMGRFDEAIAFAAANGGTPDVGNVRRTNLKYGFGLSLEQSLRSDVGVFARASWADGKTETYSFTEVENSLSAGVSVKGDRWGRSKDTFGFAVAQNGLRGDHRNYLSLGGFGAFIGDGRLNYRPERLAELYYNVSLHKTTSLMLGYQRIVNPGYNADRGPVNVGTLRLHTEF